MWTLQDGNFTVEGGSGGTGEKVLVTAGPDEVVDAAGNVIKVKQAGVVKKVCVSRGGTLGRAPPPLD